MAKIRFEATAENRTADLNLNGKRKTFTFSRTLLWTLLAISVAFAILRAL